jgi:hypothetical protein
MPADVAFTEGSQKRVTDGMEKNIRIGMTHETLCMRYLHTPEDQPSPLNKTVTVVTYTDSHLTPFLNF